MASPIRMASIVALIGVLCLLNWPVQAQSNLNCGKFFIRIHYANHQKVADLDPLYRAYINADSGQKSVMRDRYTKALDSALDDLLSFNPNLAAALQIGPETIFDARIKDPLSPLSFDELVLLSSDPMLRFVYKRTLILADTKMAISNARAFIPIKRIYSSLKALMKNANYMHSDSLSTFMEKAEPFPDALHPTEPTSILSQILSKSTDTAGAVVKQIATIVSPLPPNIHGKIERLFLGNSIAHKQLTNPELELKMLTPAEANFLLENNLVEAFDKRRAFLLTHPTLRKLRLGEKALWQSAKWLSYSAAILILISTDEKDMVTPSEVGKELKGSERKIGPKPDEIQLLNTLSPFPHLAIRIGDKVYSYGVNQMKVWPVMEYLSVDPINRRGAQNDTGMKKFFDLVHPASIQTTTLRLGIEDVKKLQSYLEAQNNKVYLNKTGVNDCATMIIRALRQNTQLNDSFLRLIDASPSQVTMSLASLKAMGDKRISKIQTIVQTQTDRPTWHRIRNAWENKIESSFFLNPTVLVTNQLSRYQLDRSYREDQLQVHLEEDENHLSKLEEANLDFIQSDVFLAFIPIKLQSLSEQQTISASELAEFRQLATSLLTEKREELQSALKDSSLDIASKKRISGSIKGLDAFALETNDTLKKIESKAVSITNDK